MKILPSIKITSATDNASIKQYQFFQKGKGDWKIECKILNSEMLEEFSVDRVIVASRSALLETQFYGDHSDQFLQEGKSSFVMNSAQYQVFHTLIVPFLYKQNITIEMNEHYIYAFALAKYLQIDSLLEELEKEKKHFINFGILYNLLHDIQNQELTCPVFDFFETVKKSGRTIGLLSQVKKKLTDCLKEFPEKVLEWPSELLLKAASKEDLYTIAVKYSTLGSKYHSKSYPFYEKAATLGHADAILEMGEMSALKRDHIKAREWYEKAIPLGNSDATYHVAYFYEYGLGGEKDMTKAMTLYKQAADMNHVQSIYRLGVYYLREERSLNAANELFSKGSELNESYSMYYRGFMLQYGLGCKQDSKKAVKWYQHIAASGDSIAESRLGACLVLGIGCTRDTTKGIQALEQFIEEGVLLLDKYYLGVFYLFGVEGVKQNFAKAIQYLQTTDNSLHFFLGYCYWKGYGVEKSSTKAIECFTQGSKWTDCTIMLGYCFSKGIIVEQNENKAKEMFDKISNCYEWYEYFVDYLETSQYILKESPNKQMALEWFLFLRDVYNTFVAYLLLHRDIKTFP